MTLTVIAGGTSTLHPDKNLSFEDREYMPMSGGGLEEFDPGSHRLQRQDAKSRKTFKIKRHHSTIKGNINRSATMKGNTRYRSPVPAESAVETAQQHDPLDLMHRMETQPEELGDSIDLEGAANFITASSDLPATVARNTLMERAASVGVELEPMSNGRNLEVRVARKVEEMEEMTRETDSTNSFDLTDSQKATPIIKVSSKMHLVQLLLKLVTKCV